MALLVLARLTHVFRTNSEVDWPRITSAGTTHWSFVPSLLQQLAWRSHVNSGQGSKRRN